MPHLPRFAVVLLVQFLLWNTAAAARKEDPLDRATPVPADVPIPVIDFFRPPVMERPSINAAGTRVVALATFRGDHTGIVIIDLDGGAKLQTLRGAIDKDVYSFAWLNDERVMFSVSKEKLYANGLYVADVTNPTNNYMIEQHSVVHLISRPMADRTKPIVWVSQNAYDEGRDAGALQVDAMRDMHEGDTYIPGMRGTKADSAGETHGVSASVLRSYPPPPEGSAVRYLPEVSGELGYVQTITRDRKYKLFALVDGRWRPCPVDLETMELETIGDRPGELLVLSSHKRGEPRGLFRVNALTGEVGELILRDPDYDCEDIITHRDYTTRRILGITYTGRTQKTVWFDPERQKVQELVQRTFPGQIVTLIDADKANDRFIVQTYSDRDPVSYHTLHLSKKAMGLMNTTRPWIDPKRMRPRQIVNYKSRDGTALEAYLTLPDGASKDHRVPLVVLPHGGPWARDVWSWDPEAQFLASRGYAVLQPNYRGSTGYDWRFELDETEDFKKMHEDVTDGAKRATRLDMIDPDRVAIMGGSFGGYLAMCGAAFEDGLYRCAVTMSGVFDFQMLMTTGRQDLTRRARYRLWERRIGTMSEEAERLAAISPLRHVDRVKIPVYVQHGRDDAVVDVEQSKHLISALKARGVPCVARLDKDEGHGNARLENRVEMYTQIEAFLGEHLGGAPATPAR